MPTPTAPKCEHVHQCRLCLGCFTGDAIAAIGLCTECAPIANHYLEVARTRGFEPPSIITAVLEAR